MIEFVGLPGSGKSVLCASLADGLGVGGSWARRTSDLPSPSRVPLAPVGPSRLIVVAGLDERSRWSVQVRKLIDAARFVATEPRLTGRLLSIIARSGQRRPTEGLTKTINLLAELGRARAGAPRLVEQGVLQAVWSVGLRSSVETTPELMSLVDPWLPAVVIRVLADHDETAARLAGRSTGRSRLDRLDHGRPGRADLEQELVRGESLLDAILTRWQQTTSGGLLVTVDNDGEIPPRDLIAPHLETITTRLPHLEVV